LSLRELDVSVLPKTQQGRELLHRCPGKKAPGKANSQCKGPEVGLSGYVWKTRMGGAQQGKPGDLVGGTVGVRIRSCRALQSMASPLDFPLTGTESHQSFKQKNDIVHFTNH
jgi:hypothetical protein